MNVVRSSFLYFLFMATPLYEAEMMITSQIVQRTLHSLPSCLDWRWIGNCLWSKCDLLGCEVQASIKVRHYRPDLLVTVQRTPSEMPWLEMRRALSSLQSSTISNATRVISSSQYIGAGGDVAVSIDLARNGDLRFFEVNVFGHPLEELPFGADRLRCQSVTQPTKPYYQSTLDVVSWRFAPIESVNPASLVPGRREIGYSIRNSWGAVYPRSGFVTQQSPAKAAAVIAQRACDIVLGPRGQHVALDLGSPHPYTKVPSHLDERDAATGRWQMISPVVDSTCALFGTDDPKWDVGRTNESRAFIWNLWRPYECCEPRGSFYLGTVHF